MTTVHAWGLHPGGSYLLEGTVLPVNRYGKNVAVMDITQDVTRLHAAVFAAEFRGRCWAR